MHLAEYEIEAIAWLKEVVGDHYAMVAFSGGKDSIVTARLVEIAQLKHNLVYSNTTIDPPAVLKFIKRNYPHCYWVRPPKSFWSMIPNSNPPLFHARWCCTALKKRPTWKFPTRHRILGIRAEESSRRNKYTRINHYTAYKQDHIHYYPILHWPEWAIWEFIAKERLEVPELYDHFHRLGCVVCPMRGYAELMRWREIYPGYFKAFEAACKKWYAKRVAQGRTMAYSTPEKFIAAWYKGKASWYAPEPIE